MLIRDENLLEFHVNNRVLLKASTMKGTICFGAHEKLNQEYIGPIKIPTRISPIVYQFHYPEDLNSVGGIVDIIGRKVRQRK